MVSLCNMVLGDGIGVILWGLWCLGLYGLAWEFARFWVLVMRCDISFRFSGFAVGLDFDVFVVVFLEC